jgi:hypothetical protein
MKGKDKLRRVAHAFMVGEEAESSDGSAFVFF